VGGGWAHTGVTVTGRKEGRKELDHELPLGAYFKGWPWTPCIARARQGLPFYAVAAATPETGLTAVSGVVARRAGDLWQSSTRLDNVGE
jgi:hypothetical protein